MWPSIFGKLPGLRDPSVGSVGSVGLVGCGDLKVDMLVENCP